MSMHTHILGFRPVDEKYKTMKAVWDACQEAGLEPPREVQRFFNDEPPDDRGVSISLDRGYPPVLAPGVLKWVDDMREGYEVDLDKLDPTIRVLRFYNSF